MEPTGKRYQVFVSSTYQDLQAERFEVVKTLLEMSCIPVSMEFYTAADEDHWSVTRRLIEESDYLIVIVAGKYGSINAEGMSHTEAEYRHALAVNKPILGFVHEDPTSLPGTRIELDDPVARKRLEEFRSLVETRLCTKWSNAVELARKVATSLGSLMQQHPGRGWIRAPVVANEEHLVLRPKSIYKISIPSLISDHLGREGLDLSQIRPMRTSLEFTVTDLERICSILHPEREPLDLSALIHGARAEAYETKYGDRPRIDDERYIFDIGYWPLEVRSVLRQMGLENLSDKYAVNVGIGQGSEGKDMYPLFRRLTGVDIAPRALEHARSHFAELVTHSDAAEHLARVGSGTQDVYLSFRTYQSTLFDIDRALFEAYRVLRPGGALVISIPHKYAQGTELKTGLLRPESQNLDPSLPYNLDPELPFTYVGKIRRTLFRLNFEDVGVTTGKVEIYIYGRRTL
jgi:SAM-dependent methyltransferase